MDQPLEVTRASHLAIGLAELIFQLPGSYH
jgi:hypothetical protein